MRALSISLLLLALSPGSAFADDALAVAHKSGDRAHALSAMRVDNAIESLNKGVVQVFGVRRDVHCPGGGQVTESACSPCTYKSEEWAERPMEQWIVDFSWRSGDEAEHALAMAKIDHFKKYFDMEGRPGVEKGGRRYVFFELKGPRPIVIEEPELTSLRLLVGGKEATLALVPVGEKDVLITARALRKAGAGALVEAPDAEVRFEAPGCARILGDGPRGARVSLSPGVERCDVKASMAKGGATATIVVRRELQLYLTCDGQRADSLVLQGANVVDLAFEAEASGKPAKVSPEWSAEGGKLEVLEQGKKARLRLFPEAAQAKVTLLDRDSGAATSVIIQRKP